MVATSITSAAIRAFSLSNMGKYIKLGYSSRMIQRDLIKRFGGAYRFQNIQADMRTVTKLGKLERLIKRLDPKLTVPRTYMIESKLLYPAKYRVHAKIKMFDIDTKEYYTRNISFYDDENRGLDGWLDCWKSQFNDDLYDQTTVIVDAQVVSVEHDKRFPY